MIIQKAKGMEPGDIVNIYIKDLVESLDEDPRVCIYRRGAAADLFTLICLLPPGTYGPAELKEMWSRSKYDLVIACNELVKRGYCEVIKEPGDGKRNIPITVKVIDDEQEETE